MSPCGFCRGGSVCWHRESRHTGLWGCSDLWPHSSGARGPACGSGHSETPEYERFYNENVNLIGCTCKRDEFVLEYVTIDVIDWRFCLCLASSWLLVQNTQSVHPPHTVMSRRVSGQERCCSRDNVILRPGDDCRSRFDLLLI